MKQVCVVGHLGLGYDLLNGQTIKTKIVTQELERKFGKENVLKVDTHGGILSYLKLPILLLKALLTCRNVAILPAQNGLRIIAPLLYVMNLFLRKKIHYIVIGGWMPKLIEDKPFLTFCLKRFDHIYVETTVMKNTLEKKEFPNVCVMLNCKPLMIVDESEINFEKKVSLKFCIFSRIMKQKGIEDAVFAIKNANDVYGENVCCLDIYGQIENGEEAWFKNLQTSFPKNIQYKGFVPFNDSVSVLKQYTALLFPTRFYTEGVPGTIIDAYAAGLPVISSRWESFADVIDDGVTGIGYEFGSEKELCEILRSVIMSPEILINMKKSCISKTKLFLPENAMQIFIHNLS